MGTPPSVLQLFAIFVNVLTPVFTLLLIGYVAGPRLQVDARSLSKVAYYILAPAFIFDIFRDASMDVLLATRMALFILLVAGGCVIICIGVARLLGHRAEMTAAFALVGAFGNVGNFGLPIIQFKLGEAALVPASFYFLVLSVFGFLVGVMAATWHRDGNSGALLSVLKTPALVAVVPAILANNLALPVPLFAERAIGLLADAMIPIMLLTLGVQLAAMGRPRLNRDVLVASSIRLVVGPALGLGLAVPFGLTGVERGAGILQASMPAAILASLIALEHDLLPDFVTTTVLVSTLASAVTLTVVLAMV